VGAATTPELDVNLPLLLAGKWLETGAWAEVLSPYDGTLLARVAVGDAGTVHEATIAAHEAFKTSCFPQHERAAVLRRAARIVAERTDELAATIANEAGKPLAAATVEARRCADTFELSAVEALKLTGSTVPMDSSAAGVGKLGVVLRVPYGVVGAISPFNFPLNLVAHKLGPAIAAGNAVVLKPAERTPMSALKLAGILLEAGLPEGWLSVVPGLGPTVGEAIVAHELIRAITFTGSGKVGWEIRSRAPHKKVNLELGSNAPLIVHCDGDWETAADKATLHAFAFAGQACISIQRIILHEEVADGFIERLVANVERLQVGDPLDRATDVGPLITPDSRDRVKRWVDEALDAGADLLIGGDVVDEGRCLAPTLLGSPPKDSKVWREEVFGPVATIDRYREFDDALAMANDTRFGLQAGVFTRDIGRGLQAARALDYGGVLINEVPSFRADQQPYGGVKESGNTREGPAAAVLELSEERFVTLQG
jgi:acyl-CoA reductase-like NAD-dependent aldehyde dehydrogenase